MRLLLLILLSPVLTQAATRDSITNAGTIKIGYVVFNFEETISAESGFAKSFNLYHQGNKILTHVLFNEEADCNSEGLELGDFVVNDSSITFYSYWAWVGGCCSPPYGARKQVYRIDKFGRLHLYESAIYLQRYSYAISAMQKQEAQLFMAKTEKEYNAKFVLDGQADDLINEVKMRFAKAIAKETKGWERNRSSYMR